MHVHYKRIVRMNYALEGSVSSEKAARLNAPRIMKRATWHGPELQVPALGHSAHAPAELWQTPR